MKEIVSAKWLHQRLQQPKLVVLEAYLTPKANKNPLTQPFYTIPHTQLFDLSNVFLDKSSTYPNTLPQPKIFEAECRKLGIAKNSKIVIFDRDDIYGSPRVWWLFKIMGRQKVSVLNGALPNWVAKGYPTVTQYSQAQGYGNFKAHYQKDLLVGFAQISLNTNKQSFLLVDARAKGRFNGTLKEPREDLKSGHIKNWVNLPYKDLLVHGKYKPKRQLMALFKEKCGSNTALVFSCGSGITACIVLLASRLVFSISLKLFDGSWTEWAQRNNLKIIPNPK